MKVFRISTTKRAGDLSGTGAKLFGGRWNSPGQPVVYCSENISLAMLETLVHADKTSLSQDFATSVLYIPDQISITLFKAEKLDEKCCNFPFDHNTVSTGDKWLAAKESAVFKVPSAVNPLEHNFLFNPLHEDFKQLKVLDIIPVSFDLRLL